MKFSAFTWFTIQTRDFHIQVQQNYISHSKIKQEIVCNKLNEKY